MTANEEMTKTVGAKLAGDWLDSFRELEATGLSATSIVKQGIVRLLTEYRQNGFLRSEKLPPKQGQLGLPNMERAGS